ncbi:hypothetical protein ES708_30370 [subsurface metagenome]
MTKKVYNSVDEIPKDEENTEKEATEPTEPQVGPMLAEDPKKVPEKKKKKPCKQYSGPPGSWHG